MQTLSGADMSIKDKKNRNFLHLAILNGAKLQHFGDDLFKVASKILFLLVDKCGNYL